jgi:hypothetical protein
MSAERGFVEKRAVEVRNLSLVFAAFFGLFAKWGATALSVGIAGMSHLIAKHQEKKRLGYA